jgi:hypothetical protein
MCELQSNVLLSTIFTEMHEHNFKCCFLSSFPLASTFRPALGPTQPPVKWVPGVLSRGGKAQPGRDVDHSPQSRAEVKNE